MAKNAIWYTEGWGWLGLRVRLMMWLIRQMYRLRFVNEEIVERSAGIITGAAIRKKMEKAGLKGKEVKDGRTN